MNDDFLNQLSRLTRYGLLDSTTPRARGLSITGNGGQSLNIGVDQINQAIDAIAKDSTYDFGAAVTALMTRPIDSLPRTQPELLRLRSYLLLASGPARPWARDTNPRRAAVARTYRRSTSGYYEELTDAVRAQLLRELTDELAGSVTTIVVETPSPLTAAASGRPPLRPSYVTELYDGTRQEPMLGEPLRNRHRRTIRATSDGVTEFRQIMTFSWRGTDFPAHSVIGMGEFSIENASTRDVNGVLYHQYELVIPTPTLNVGERTLVAWDVSSPTNDKYFEQDDRKRIFGIGPSGIVETARVTVDFAEGRLPQAAWRLDGLPRDAENILDHPAAVEINPAESLQDTWSNLAAGRIVGFRWQWRRSSD